MDFSVSWVCRSFFKSKGLVGMQRVLGAEAFMNANVIKTSIYHFVDLYQ